MMICGHTVVTGNTKWICDLPPHAEDDDEYDITQRGPWVVAIPTRDRHRYINANRVDATPGPD